LETPQKPDCSPAKPIRPPSAVPFRSAASYRGFGQILTKRFPTTFVGNLHETILPVHGSFAVLFSALLSGQA
jgi:hypothetical protein